MTMQKLAVLSPVLLLLCGCQLLAEQRIEASNPTQVAVPIAAAVTKSDDAECPGGRIKQTRRTTDVNLGRTRHSVFTTDSCLE
jgi:hypothetical protein